MYKSYFYVQIFSIHITLNLNYIVTRELSLYIMYYWFCYVHFLLTLKKRHFYYSKIPLYILCTFTNIRYLYICIHKNSCEILC